jgi:hypothetical protein
LTVLLSTALFVLGFQAVGSERSLTNPHHGIGVALYTLVMTQALAGCVIHRREKGKERFKVPLKLMVCHSSCYHGLKTNTPPAPPMDRSSYCNTWHCTSSPRPDLVRISQNPFHPVCGMVLATSPCLFLPELQEPARSGLR